jgi:hypothetical protein
MRVMHTLSTIWSTTRESCGDSNSFGIELRFLRKAPQPKPGSLGRAELQIKRRYEGYPQQFQTSKAVRGIFAYGINNNLAGNEVGAAAGEASDPMYLPAGIALPYQIEIDIDLNSDLPNLQTAVAYYALDSNTDPGDDNPDTADYPGQIDDFTDADNAETLWTLAFSSTA